LHEWITRRSQAQPSTRTRFNAGTLQSHYQRDRARVIHSSWFRSLQSKTQVLGLGESDFYRTRLTHSLEVAQIGTGICESLRANATAEQLEWLAPNGLMDAICLAHDIGHSPFGHGGEVALNYMMHEHGGFEANGQTLRILARLGEYSEKNGLDLTRRATLGVIKYPGFCDQLASYQTAATHGQDSNIDAWTPPKGIYAEEKDVLDWTLEPFVEHDRERFCSTTAATNKHSRTIYKSFDTSIMEIADDIAYGVHDLEDAVALSLITAEQWQQDFVEPLKQLDNNPVAENLQFYTDGLFSADHRRRKRAISRLVGWFINSVDIEQQAEFEHPLLHYKARLQAIASEVLSLLKRFVMDTVILRPELQALQYKGQRVILMLFETLLHNQKRLLPRNVYAEVEQSSTPRRIICDYISALTDASATRLYHRLSTPSAGSIFDRI